MLDLSNIYTLMNTLLFYQILSGIVAILAFYNAIQSYLTYRENIDFAVDVSDMGEMDDDDIMREMEARANEEEYYND